MVLVYAHIHTNPNKNTWAKIIFKKSSKGNKGSIEFNRNVSIIWGFGIFVLGHMKSQNWILPVLSFYPYFIVNGLPWFLWSNFISSLSSLLILCCVLVIFTFWFLSPELYFEIFYFSNLLKIKNKVTGVWRDRWLGG